MSDDNSFILITGGTGVVGTAIVRRLLLDGSRVCVTYSSNTAALAALRSAEAESGQLLAIHADLSRHEQVTQLVDQIERAGAKIKAFVHSAALVDQTPMPELGAIRFSEVFAVNVTASYLLVRELIARSQLRTVVLLSSIGADFAGMGSIAYTASKGAVDALTRALAAELAPSVRVNAVAPGIVRSHRTDADSVLSNEAFMKRIPEGALVDAAQVAEVVSFLLDERSRFITGQVLKVDGGISLRLM